VIRGKEHTTSRKEHLINVKGCLISGKEHLVIVEGRLIRSKE
jgi:hypothetical protein